MAKDDVVAMQLAAVQAAEIDALKSGLGTCYDQGALDQKGQDGTLSQGDLDAAVAAAVAPLTAQIAQDKADLDQAHSDGASALAALQKQLDDMSAAKSADDSVIQGLQGSLGQLQSFLDQLKALILPAAPVPAPAPIDPVPAA